MKRQEEDDEDEEDDYEFKIAGGHRGYRGTVEHDKRGAYNGGRGYRGDNRGRGRYRGRGNRGYVSLLNNYRIIKA